jgi:hypothetical protein
MKVLGPSGGRPPEGGFKEGQGEPGRAGPLEEFEKDLRNNQYKNRMSSSSYFPPPVPAVAQTVVASVLESRAEPLLHPTPTATDQDVARWTLWPLVGSAVGSRTGAIARTARRCPRQR